MNNTTAVNFTRKILSQY